MQLKPFEAGRYDEESIVVNNPENGKQELFTEREYAIVKFLKQNEKQSLLALLMPNIGIAKKTHIEMCLRVLSKLRRIQVTDYFSITGRKPSGGETGTTDVVPEKARIELTSLHALAATAIGVAGKALAPIGQAGLLGGVVGLAAFSFALFPFDLVDSSLRNNPPAYAPMFVFAYLTVCVCLCLRAIVQASYLRIQGREALEPVVALHPPFISLAADVSGVNLLGFKARVQMAVLGLVAPFALSFVYAILAMVRALNPGVAFVGLAACAGTSLALACPLLNFDGADFLQAVFFRDGLTQKVSSRLRDIFQVRGTFGRELVFTVGLALAWVAVWLDCLRAFHDTFAERIMNDLARGSAADKAGAGFTLAILLALVLMPAAVVVLHQLRERARRNRKRVVVQKDKVKDSLTFEERISALEKIPLFAYLNDQERLALLNEMQPAFFKHGDFLVHQGELGKEFYVLVKGQASAQYRDMAGKVVVLAGLVEGDAFGEIALIDDVPRTASVVSDGGCIALVLRKEGFDHFAESLGSPDRVKSMVRLTSFFRRHPLFSKLSPRDQAQLIDSFRFQTITAGEQVSEGDDSFHVIYAGSVRVDTGGADGETTLSSDDCFGYSNPLNARFVALEGTGLLSVPKDEFHNLIWEKLVEKPELFV
ncbi:MAG: cyclic nucleotide-binding domain-containing protein [Bdellovibrionota bacterium]